MRVLVLADPADAPGFGLAGAAVRTPADRRELLSTLAHLLDERPPVGLLLVSAPVADLAPAALRAFAERPGAPPLLVLPAGGSHEDAR